MQNQLWLCFDTAKPEREVTLKAVLPRDCWKEIEVWSPLLKHEVEVCLVLSITAQPVALIALVPVCDLLVDSHREASCTFPRIAPLFLAWPAEAQGTNLTGDWPWAQSLHNVLQSPISSWSFLWSSHKTTKQDTVLSSRLFKFFTFSVLYQDQEDRAFGSLRSIQTEKVVVQNVWDVLSPGKWHYWQVHWTSKILLQIFFW